jgi:acyl-CoA reductase-like NAD-dependent aldehyde dehydrogenase
MTHPSSARPHLPILRFGRSYRSLDVLCLTDLRDGAPVATVSQANPGLVARDLARAGAAQAALGALRVAELLAIARRAASLFMEAELPLGEGGQTPEEYVAQLSATTGMPRSLARRNMEKLRFVLAEMETVLAGLTRGLDLEILDRGYSTAGRRVSYRRETDVLGAILPSNSPGVHSLWLPAPVLKVAMALKPGRQEPWTPYRIAQAFIAAGCPAEAWGFYPTSYAGASEILLSSGRSLLFGDEATVAPWRGDPRVERHGPGWSKVVFGADRAPAWRQHLELLAASVADNGGRSCINASAIWTPSHGREMAQALAERLASIGARPLDDPEARLAAFPSREAAQRLSAAIDAQLRAGGAEELTAPLREGGRVAEVDGCAFLLPTVVWCEDPDHPLARAEYLFPFVTVVEVAQEEMLSRMGPSLVVTGLTEDPAFRRALLAAGQIDRLNLGPIPTSKVSWDQPHEGNLFEHLYRCRAFQTAEAA